MTLRFDGGDGVAYTACMLAPRPRQALTILVTALTCVALDGTSDATGGSTRLAVAEFENAGADASLAALGKGLQSMLTTDLTGVSGVQVIERQQLGRVMAELDLGKAGRNSGRMDKSTLAKLGKLVGATRLLGGSFMVVGGKMRLDGRLYAVETGEVLIAASIEGDKDAFFDLEKQLAHKVVGALGVVLAPKERTVLSRVQTVDFEAFAAYSRGLAAFDDKRYDDAVKAMGDATRRDKDFLLATRTLEQYQKLVAELRAHAQDIADSADADRAVKERKALASEAAQSAPVIDALWKIAGQPGGGDKQRERLAALAMLADSRQLEAQLRGDKFALDRTRDDLQKRYFAEAKALFPKLPPIVLDFVARQLRVDRPVQDSLAEALRVMELQMRGPNRSIVPTLAGELARVEELEGLSAHLQLDRRASPRLAEQLVAWGDALEPEHDFHVRMTRTMAKIYRRALELDRSTAAFVAATKTARDKADVQAIAREIEHNARLVKLLPEVKSPIAKELLLLGGLRQADLVERELRGPQPTPKALQALAKERRLGGKLVYVGDVPVWPVEDGFHDLASGPRSDERRTSELRYLPSIADRIDKRFRNQPAQALVVVGARPRRDGTLSFKIDFTPATDVWREEVNKSREPPPGLDRPLAIGVAFGIQHASDKDRAQGYALVLGRSELTLVRWSFVKRIDDYLRWKEIETKALAARPFVGPTGGTAMVSVRFTGKVAEVEVAGRKISIDIPDDRDGFQGLLFRDFGYAGISRLTQR